MKRLSIILAGLIFIAGNLQPLNAEQLLPLEVSVIPTIDIPTGPGIDLYGGKPPYSLGFGAGIRGDFTIPFLNFVFARVALDYTLLPIPNGEIANTPDMSLITIGTGAGLKLSPFEKFDIKAGLQGGYYIGIIEGISGGHIFLKTGIEGSYNLSSSIKVGLGASYRYFMLPPNQDVSSPTNLYNGLQILLGLTYDIGAGSRQPKVKFIDIKIDKLFPVLYKYYDTHPLGTVTLKNSEARSIKNVKLTFFVKQYMDKPKLCTEIAELKRGEQKEIPLFALFTDDILNITEGNTVNAELKVQYQYLGDSQQVEKNDSAKIIYRNAITWDDDRKAAAFITAKDPVILRLAKNAVSDIRHEEPKPINENFRKAVNLFAMLGLYGMSYIIDPNSSYAELSNDKYSLDYLQFPAESLSYKGGDCDDLSILYTSLLEAVGVSTAIITVPGHIFTAFDLDMDPTNARRTFTSSRDLIFIEGKTWLPVETTLVGRDFVAAWKEGARQWKINSPDKSAFYPVHKAWNNYPPVANPGKFGEIKQPSSNKLLRAYKKQIDKFITAEIGTKIDQLKKRIRLNRGIAKDINHLGVLYARYGMYKEAKDQFLKIANYRNYLPGIINLANIYFIQGDFNRAKTYYEMAKKKEAHNITALLGLSKAYYELGMYNKASSTFEEAKNQNPKTAEKYAYLYQAGSASTRGASAASQEITQWEE